MSKKLTTQRLHKVIQEKINVLSSFYSVSQRINRTTYSVNTSLKGVYGVFSTSYLNEICEALDEAGIQYDNSQIERGFIKVRKFQ